MKKIDLSRFIENRQHRKEQTKITLIDVVFYIKHIIQMLTMG